MCGNMFRQLMLISIIVFATIQIGPIYADSGPEPGLNNKTDSNIDPQSVPIEPSTVISSTPEPPTVIPVENTTTIPTTTPAPSTPNTTVTIPTTTIVTTVPPKTTTPTIKPNSTTPSTPNPTTPNPTTNTTVPAPTQVTTIPPKPTAEPSKDRHFDGPSFIGGIVLSVGIMAIAFVSWKFYKARSERNYHTL